MGTLYRRPRSPFFYMRFSANGRRVDESTKAKTEREAQAVMNRRIKELSKGQGWWDFFDKMKSEIRDLEQNEKTQALHEIDRYISEQQANITLDHLWALYEESPKRQTQSDIHKKTVKRHWGKFKTWIEENHSRIKSVSDIGPILVEQYLGYLWKGEIAPRTYNSHLVSIKAVFADGCRLGILTRNPFSSVAKLDNESISKEPLTSDELKTIFRETKGDYRILFLMGLHTGMRLGDCATIQWDSIDLKKKIFVIEPSKTKKKKREIRIPISETLLPELKKIKPKNRTGYLLPDMANNYLKDPSSVSKVIQRIFELAGIQTTIERNNRKQCIRGFHSFRHSFISLLAESGTSEAVLMSLAGHSSTTVSRIYQHISDDSKREAVSNLPNL
jgi:integrase